MVYNNCLRLINLMTNRELAYLNLGKTKKKNKHNNIVPVIKMKAKNASLEDIPHSDTKARNAINRNPVKHVLHV